mmetsp:Transcript_107844/g.247165  ORF Transcript_107844/g.247165 Transcript_107844/m.247165 type:complete len:226 (+) Transcript_107844:92-769(+)
MSEAVASTIVGARLLLLVCTCLSAAARLDNAESAAKPEDYHHRHHGGHCSIVGRGRRWRRRRRRRGLSVHHTGVRCSNGGKLGLEPRHLSCHASNRHGQRDGAGGLKSAGCGHIHSDSGGMNLECSDQLGLEIGGRSLRGVVGGHCYCYAQCPGCSGADKRLDDRTVITDLQQCLCQDRHVHITHSVEPHAGPSAGSPVPGSAGRHSGGHRRCGVPARGLRQGLW